MLKTAIISCEVVDHKSLYHKFLVNFVPNKRFNLHQMGF